MDRRLLQGLAARFGSVSNRDRTAMDKWVSAAASWTRAAELIDSRVAHAVQVGWDYFWEEGPPRKRPPELGAALETLDRLIRDTTIVPRPPLRPPSRSVRAASDHSARAASAHSSRQAGSASHPQAGSASRPQAGSASEAGSASARPPAGSAWASPQAGPAAPCSASLSPPAPAAQVPRVAPAAPAEAPRAVVV